MHHELAELPLILSSFGMSVTTSVTSDGLLMCLPEYIGRSLSIAPHVESQGRLDVFVPLSSMRICGITLAAHREPKARRRS